VLMLAISLTLRRVDGRGEVVAVLAAGLAAGWAVSLATSKDLVRLTINGIPWNAIATRWSA
jgi:hypothetical protein